MTRSLALSLLSLSACADPSAEVQARPDAALAPPLVVNLDAMTAVVPTGTLTLTATAPVADGTLVWFALGRSSGPGRCPRELRGACLDITGQPVVLGSVPAAGGEATLDLTVPANAPLGSWAVQAVVYAGGAFRLSNVDTFDVVEEICGDGLVTGTESCDDPPPPGWQGWGPGACGACDGQNECAGAPDLDVDVLPGISGYTSSGSWQSFTAESTGYLTGWTFHNYAPFQSYCIRARVFVGEGSGGAVVDDQIFCVGSSSSYDLISVAEPYPVTAGQVLTVMMDYQSGILGPSGDGGNPYPGGRWRYDANGDMAIRTYVAPFQTCTI